MNIFRLPLSASVLRGGGATNNTYYVDGASGNDANSGLTTAKAWKTIAKVNASVFNAGDSVLFKGSTTFSGTKITLGVANYSGTTPPTLARPLTIGSYGTGQATISTTAAGGFLALNIGNFTLRDLIFTGSGTGSAIEGVFADNTLAGNIKLGGVSIINLTVSGFTDVGIQLGGDTGSSGYDGALIQNCTIHDCGNEGIGVYGTVDYAITNLTIDSCTCYNITGNASQNGAGSGIVVGSVNGGLLTNCVAHDCGSNASNINGPVGMYAYQSNAVIFTGCETYNQTTLNTDGGGFDLDGGCSNCIIEYCYSHNNAGSGFLAYNYGGVEAWTGNTYRFNISQSDCQAGATASFIIDNDGSGMTGPNIYNNTIYASHGTSAGFYIGQNNFGGTIANNIIYSTGTTKMINTANTPNAALAFRGNDYFFTGSFSLKWNVTTYTSYATWQTATGQEKISGVDVGLQVDPLLTSAGTGGNMGNNPASLTAYQLQHTSTLIGAGRNMQTDFSINPGTLDFYGDTIPNGGAGTGFNVGADGANR